MATNYKQLLNDADQDIQINSGWCQCYLPKKKAEEDNIDRGLNDSGYPAKAEFNNCSIIHSISSDKTWALFKSKLYKYCTKIVVAIFVDFFLFSESSQFLN